MVHRRYHILSPSPDQFRENKQFVLRYAEYHSIFLNNEFRQLWKLIEKKKKCTSEVIPVQRSLRKKKRGWAGTIIQTWGQSDRWLGSFRYHRMWPEFAQLNIGITNSRNRSFVTRTKIISKGIFLHALLVGDDRKTLYFHTLLLFYTVSRIILTAPAKSLDIAPGLLHPFGSW